MGGCAGKMKGSADDLPPEPLPSEAPVSHTEAEGETVVQEKEAGEKPTEAPLVDLSEPKQEAENSSSAEPKTEEAAAEPEKKEETAATTSEEKVEAAAVATKETAKDTEKEEIKAAVPTKEEEKSDAPIVIV